MDAEAYTHLIMRRFSSKAGLSEVKEMRSDLGVTDTLSDPKLGFIDLPGRGELT